MLTKIKGANTQFSLSKSTISLANRSFEPVLKRLIAFIVNRCLASIDWLNCQIPYFFFFLSFYSGALSVRFVAIMMCKLHPVIIVYLMENWVK